MTRSPRAVGGVHWPELDGLRALAILLVIARHSLRPFISEDAFQPVVVWGGLDLTPFLMNGWVGVDLFFVLSGFLIGRQAFRDDSWGRFWFKRVTRIVPAYWTCLLLVALGISGSGTWSQSGWDFAAHLLMLQDYTGSVFVPAFWSLGAEEKFYLLAPLLALALGRLGSSLAQATGLAALWTVPVTFRLLQAQGVAAPLEYLAYFPAFRSPFHLTCESLVLGFAIAWATLRLRAEVLGPRAREAAFWVGACGLAAMLGWSTLLRDIGPFTIVVAPAAVGLGFGAMVLACVSGPGSYSRFLAWTGWKPLALGSFSLYLTHMMVIPLAGAAGRALVGSSPDSVTVQWLGFFPWYLALSAVSAWVLYALVERPVLVWREGVLKSWSRGADWRLVLRLRPVCTRVTVFLVTALSWGFAPHPAWAQKHAQTPAPQLEKPKAAPPKPTAAPAKPRVTTASARPTRSTAPAQQAASHVRQTPVSPPTSPPTPPAAPPPAAPAPAPKVDAHVHSSPLHNQPPVPAIRAAVRALVARRPPVSAGASSATSSARPIASGPRYAVSWPTRKVSLRWPAMPERTVLAWPLVSRSPIDVGLSLDSAPSSISTGRPR